MSSRSLQIKAVSQKIERLQANLDYLIKLDQIEVTQTQELSSKKDNE